MGNVRYRAYWENMDADKFRIDIVDTSFSGAPLPFEIGLDREDGFTLDYTSNNAERHNPIITSQCTVTCSVESAAFETMITDIVAAEEKRFFLAIYKETSPSTYTVYWAGIVLQDLITMEDLAYPYQFEITANDGLARLEDVRYSETETTETFIEYLTNIINHTGLDQFWGSTEAILRTDVNWLEDSMYTGTPAASLDPLNVTRVDNVAYLVEDEDISGWYVLDSAFNILADICRMWGASIRLADGRFNFFQLNEFENNTFTTRDYDKTGTARAANAGDSYKVTSFTRSGSYQFFKPLQQVRQKYNYTQSKYASNWLPNQDKFETALSLGMVQSGSGVKFIFSGQVRCHLDLGGGSPWQVRHRFVFKMKLQVGSYYLTNTNGYYEWTTTASFVWIFSMFHIGHNNYYFNINLGFTTPEMPASGSTTFQFLFVELQDEDYQTITPPSPATTEYQCVDFTLMLEQGSTGLSEGQLLFIAKSTTDGTTLVDSTSILDLEDSRTGDGPDPYSDGALQVWDGIAWGVSNEEWTLGTGGTEYNINDLLVREILAGQRVARKIYYGTVCGDITAISVLIIDSKKFVFRAGRYNANKNEWNGEWFELETDYGYIAIDNKLNPGGDPKTLFRGVGAGSLSNDICEEVEKLRTRKATPGKSTIASGAYTIKETEFIIYAQHAGIGTTLTLPPYTGNEKKEYFIINIDASNSITIGRDDSAELINGSASDFTLAADTAIRIHHSDISTIGWATILKTSRK